MLSMHALQVFKQVEEAHGVAGWQPVIFQVSNQLVLAAHVPLAFVKMAPSHFNIIDGRHRLERRSGRVVPP
ncbi:hypothetical protein [Mesorhizobium sp.]|uniref:hypothetical protein n=1 Tax=Mesorhizobium sp. TaxID=1871066 RepID=UPI000FE36A4C|nr:hypothetical protein [Mesorhizobium sp.]RWJ96524.1 MAG: hypothetical protein EOR42_30250 [Mesorhizobium sp.]